MNSIAGCLHQFSIEPRSDKAFMAIRRYRFECECREVGPWRRDRDSAIEDGMYHQEGEA